jgi:hypothetical protein
MTYGPTNVRVGEVGKELEFFPDAYGLGGLGSLAGATVILAVKHPGASSAVQFTCAVSEDGTFVTYTTASATDFPTAGVATAQLIVTLGSAAPLKTDLFPISVGPSLI